MLHRGQHDGEEICIVLESGPTHSSLPTFCNVRHMQCTNFVLQVTDRCEQVYEWECVKLCYRTSWHLKHIRMIAAM